VNADELTPAGFFSQRSQSGTRAGKRGRACARRSGGQAAPEVPRAV